MAYNPTFTHDPRGKWTSEENTSIVSVVGGSDAYVMEDEFNLVQWMLSEARADVVRKAMDSGVVDYVGAINTALGVPANGEVMVASSPDFAKYPNYIRLGVGDAFINGYKVTLSSYHTNSNDSGYTLNGLTLDAPPTSNVTPSLPGSARDDLVFLEAWFEEVSSSSGSADTNLYQYGGVNSGTVTNDIQDSRYPGKETTRRVQLRWRIRVVDGVDFANSTSDDAMSPASTSIPSTSFKVFPQGALATPVNQVSGFSGYLWENSFKPANSLNNPINDMGLYVYDYNNDSANQWKYTDPKTVDEKVYAIPLFRVRRRNSTAFDPDSNLYGGMPYAVYTDLSTSGSIAYGASGTLIFAGTSLPFKTGQVLTVNAGAAQALITNIAVGSTNTTLTVTNIRSDKATINYGWNDWIPYESDRPDGLYSNIIDASDIIDLRHQVSLTGFDYDTLLKKNLDLLLRGQLTTAKTLQYARDYLGVNTASYADDVNTLLYCKFDGSMAGTANGAAVTNTKVGSGTEAYKNGVQGLGADFSSNYGEQYAVSIPATNWTIEGFIKPNFLGNYASQADVFTAFNGSDSVSGRTMLCWCSNDGFHLQLYATGGGSSYSVPAIDMSNMKAGEHHYFKATYDGTTISLTLGDKVSTLALSGWNRTSTNIVVGDEVTTPNNGFQGSIDLFRISNILRSGTPLPTNFSYANGDRILDGPYADTVDWADDNGGTALVGGRTIPYGLTDVPNQMAGRIGYNGSEIRHYYGQGETPGWGVDGNTGSNPTGSFDFSYEFQSVNSNETPDGTRTTFTFTLPPNGVGLFLTDNSGTPGSLSANTVTFSSASVGTGNTITVTTSSAPASGSTVEMWYRMAQRHAHFVPATKGFVIHDWTDDKLSGTGTTTTFQTTKYDVAKLNHVRVGGVIQNGGYSVSGLNVTGVLYSSAAANATSIVVSGGLPSSVATGQNIRISDGAGGWVTTSITGTGTAVTGGYSYPVNALSKAVPANAIVEGAAVITFTTAPASGTNNIDIVYESVVRPSEGDYIRAAYQRTPYQGLYGNAQGNDSFQVAYAPTHAGFLTTIGTGNGTTPSVAGWAKVYPAMSAVLPMLGADYQLKRDTISLTNTTVTSISAQFTAHEQVYETNYDGGQQNLFTPNTTITLSGNANRGATEATLKGVSGGNVAFYKKLRDLTSAIPHLAGIPFLVFDTTTQELILAVATCFRTTADNSFTIDTSGQGGAIDVFKLQGRPLVKAYGGVTA